MFSSSSSSIIGSPLRRSICLLASHSIKTRNETNRGKGLAMVVRRETEESRVVNREQDIFLAFDLLSFGSPASPWKRLFCSECWFFRIIFNVLTPAFENIFVVDLCNELMVFWGSLEMKENNYLVWYRLEILWWVDRRSDTIYFYETYDFINIMYFYHDENRQLTFIRLVSHWSSVSSIIWIMDKVNRMIRGSLTSPMCLIFEGQT